MSASQRKKSSRAILVFLAEQKIPVPMRTIASVVSARLGDDHLEHDIRDLVQAMIVTGKLKYVTDLKVALNG